MSRHPARASTWSSAFAWPRLLAILGLREAGPAGETEVRSMLTDPELQPYARLWLTLPSREAS